MINYFSDEWVKNQVLFWGGRYNLYNNNTWTEMGSLLNPRQVLTNEDTTLTIKMKDYPTKWGQNRYDEHLEKIQQWNNIKQFSKDHVYPFLIGDNTGRTRPTLGYSRPMQDGYGMLCFTKTIWDRFCSTPKDTTSYEEKINKIHFLGSFTGPFVSKQGKTSRLEIVSKWFEQTEWFDGGFILKPTGVKDRTDFEKEIKHLIKPPIPLKDVMNHKFILCIEGNDVSSSFPWAMDSNCVPIHPYPFKSASYHMNGIEPYKHFIPIKHDASDLHDVWNWCQQNQEICKQIAQAGTEHMKPIRDKELVLKVEAEVVKLWDLRMAHIKL